MYLLSYKSVAGESHASTQIRGNDHKKEVIGYYLLDNNTTGIIVHNKIRLSYLKINWRNILVKLYINFKVENVKQ